MARWEGTGDQFPPCPKYPVAQIPAARIAWGFGRIGNRDLLQEIGILFREEGGEMMEVETGEERETGGTS